MVLDHINGIHNDNRLENLRMLCPNCNSQTLTFTGRNSKYRKTKYCSECKLKLPSWNRSGLCSKCYHDKLKIENLKKERQIINQIINKKKKAR